MPAAFVKNGVAGVVATGTGLSVALTVPAGGHAVGNTLVLAATYVTGVSDSKGNTWVALGGGVYGSVLTTALVAGDTITVTNSPTSTGHPAATYAEFSGVTLTLDGAINTSGTGTSATPTAGAVTPAVGELVIATFFVSGSDATKTAGTGFTLAPTNTIVFAVPEMEWQVASASGSVTPGMTLGASRAYSSTALVLGVGTPINTATPSIATDGTPQTGETITIDRGTWSNAPTSFTGQIYSDGVAQTGGIYQFTFTAQTQSLVLPSALEGHVVKCRVTATNASGSTTADTGTITPAAATPLATSDIKRMLSGGASNTDPLLSIGGAQSSQAYDPLTILGRVQQAQATAGQTDYRLIYIKNTHTVYSAAVGAYVPTQPSETHEHLAVGVATELAGVTVAATANTTTAPAGVTFSAPATSGAPVDMGTLAPGQSRGLWVRRTLDAGTPVNPVGGANACGLGLSVTQL
jgi:hypothetical protein